MLNPELPDKAQFIVISPPVTSTTGVPPSRIKGPSVTQKPGTPSVRNTPIVREASTEMVLLSVKVAVALAPSAILLPTQLPAVSQAPPAALFQVPSTAKSAVLAHKQRVIVIIVNFFINLSPFLFC